MKRIFCPYIPFDDPRCKNPIPHSLEIINDAVLYISGEIQTKPSKYPFSGRSKRPQIEEIVSNYILDRLLNKSDNNHTRNYLLGSIEYCLLSSPSSIAALGSVQQDDNKQQSQSKSDSESIGLIYNISFLNSFKPLS